MKKIMVVAIIYLLLITTVTAAVNAPRPDNYLTKKAGDNWSYKNDTFFLKSIDMRSSPPRVWILINKDTPNQQDALIMEGERYKYNDIEIYAWRMYSGYPDIILNVQMNTPTSIAKEETSAVSLHGEKTNVTIGEDVLLKLSVVHLINKPPMTVQVMIIPPSGMSVTAQDFVMSGAGIYTTTYYMNEGSSRDIEVRIKTNQVGDFNVKGKVLYFFGEDKANAESRDLDLQIKVRAVETINKGPSQVVKKESPGFETLIAVFSLLIIRRKSSINQTIT